MNPKRWKVTPLHQAPAVLVFREGISREELQTLYPGTYIEPVADVDRAAAPSTEVDSDET